MNNEAAFFHLYSCATAFLQGLADNVYYGPSPQGKTLTHKEVIGYLQQADLDASFAKRSITGLSGGQAQ
jgi:ABC-type iron transport system FetAB ATPase subunit